MTKAYEFDVTVTSRHEELDEAMKQNAINEILKLSRYHNHIIDGDITIDRQNTAYKAEISLRIPGHTFTAHHEDYKVTRAIVTAIDKTKNQLKKLKSKIIDHRAPHSVEEVLEVAGTEEAEE